MQTQQLTQTPPARNVATRTRQVAGPAMDALDLYMGALADHSPLQPELELECAQRIRSRRGELWRTLLSYAPLCGPMCSLIRTRLPSEPPPPAELDDALLKMRSAAASARRARSAAGQDSLRAAAEELAKLLVDLDQDDAVAKLIGADVEALSNGKRDELSMHLRRAPSHNAPFVAFAQRAKRARTRLDSAKRKFAAANLRLVVSMAKRFEYSRIPLADLIQEGNLGLLKAVDRFDHQRGFRFSTYATWWIRHALTRAVYNGSRTVRLPVHVQERQRQISKFRRKFERDHGRAPNDNEIAKRLSVSEAKVKSAELDHGARAVSLDAPLSPRGETSLADSLHDSAERGMDEIVIERELLGKLEDGYIALDAVELDIVRRRFGLEGRVPETLREVGASHGLSRERIRQIQGRALLKMRSALLEVQA